MNRTRRVVVTGMGVVCPTGNTVAEAWKNAAAGKTGIGTITNFDTSHLDIHFGGEVKNLALEKTLSQREIRRADRVTHMALIAAQQALEDAGLQITDDNRYDIGCLVGTGIGGMGSYVDSCHSILERGILTLKPLAVPMALPDASCTQISMRFGLRGPVFSISAACATGNICIGEAADIVRRGDAAIMLAGSSEANLVDAFLAGVINMTPLSRRNDAPETASRPFDADRDGFVMGEGAALLVLEDLEHALARGAKIYAEILGYAHTMDGERQASPEGAESAGKAIEFALKNARVSPTEIDYVNAHGSSARLDDQNETLALKQAFGARAYEVPISSTKSVTGHLVSGAGAVEAVFTIMAMQDNFVPPTVNLDHPDPACDLNFTPHTGILCEIRRAISNNFEFGGHHAVIVFGKYES